MRKSGPAALAIYLLCTSSAGAQVVPVSTEEFDCVIEPKSLIKLGSPEEGIVSQISVQRGDLVSEGQVVAQLESELQRLVLQLARLRAGSDVAVRSSRARLRLRRTEAARVEELHSKEVVATTIYDEAMIEAQLAELAVEGAELEHAMAQAELAKAKEHLARRTIRSPVDGVVVEVTVAPGEYVYEQAPLMQLAELDPLKVEAFLPVAHYADIGVGMAAEVRAKVPVSSTHRAYVAVVDRVLDPASGTFGVRVQLPNPGYVLPAGQRCRVRFLPGEPVAAESSIETAPLVSNSSSLQSYRGVPVPCRDDLPSETHRLLKSSSSPADCKAP